MHAGPKPATQRQEGGGGWFGFTDECRIDGQCEREGEISERNL